MRQYITGKAGLTRLLTVVLTTSLLTVLSCADELEKTDANHNLTLSTRAGETAAQQIPSMRLFNFNHGGSDDKKFYQEVLNVTRSTDKLTAQVEVGQWNMALVSNPNGGTIIKPVANKVISQLPLYKYEPTYANGVKTTDAHEMYLDNQLTPNITSGGSHSMNAQLNRTVARVDLIIKKTTPNFNLSGTHKIKLHNVPSTISYTGDLLPNAAAPDTLNRALEAPVNLVNANDGSYKGSDTITFIIPAHRGDAYKSASPTDVVGVKMDVTLNLERTGGTRFAKQEQIQIVAQCNKILRVEITVNDGITFDTSIQDWEGVGVNSNVGKGYQNWLYVKKGATGNGLSWSDALPDINSAITKASALMAAGKTVNGILVAGDSSLTYAENINCPSGIKIYGGWSGTPTHELEASDAFAPYKSTHRDLKNYKVRLNLSGSNRVQVNAANTLLDGFIINGATTNSGDLVTVGNASAAINAIEITKNATTSGNVLSMTAGTASNILVADNTRGITVNSGAKLVNATIANNANTSNIAGSILLNSAFWRSATNGTANSVMNCAFEGTIPSGTANVGLNNNNIAWFAVGNAVPGPHFHANTNTSAKYYEALNDRCPLVGRGLQSSFDNNTSYIPVGYKTDIDGKDRHITNNDRTNAITDIGCYEAVNSFKGFILSWATDEIYVSYQAKYVSEYPLILPDNDIYDIGVDWTATWTSTASTYAYPSLTDTRDGTKVSSTSGGGTDFVVGSLFFKNAGTTTPNDDYTSNSKRECGTIKITTNLGNYLPDATIKVIQLPGKEHKYINGYVGSFHRNKEVGARNISMTNSSAWEARIISGLDWIKIDGKAKTYGEAITDPDEGTPPSGPNADSHYRQVEQVWKGVVSGTSGNIQFRVGMQSKNTTGSPRYGLIAITTNNGTSMFFVRQGEDDDYLYRTGDEKPNKNARTNLVRVSPYNLTDPAKNTSTTGSDLGAGGGRFVDYPTKLGYYFQWNHTKAYRPGQSNTLETATNTRYDSWSTAREVCPSGYRQISHVELVNSVYYNVETPTDLSARSSELTIDPTGDDVKKNALWGAYADGYYDQLSTSPVNTTAATSYGSGGDMAVKGTLMVNHYNYSSVFYPGGGRMHNGNASLQATPYSMYYTTTYYYGDPNKSFQKGDNRGSNSHWYISAQNNQHIGMNCTPILYNHAATTRCVK